MRFINLKMKKTVITLYLGLSASWVDQVLAGHLNRLISPSKLSGVHQALLTSCTVGVRYSYQIGSLGTEL